MGTSLEAPACKCSPALCTHICLPRGEFVQLVNYSPALKEYSFTYCWRNFPASWPSKLLWIIISDREGVFFFLPLSVLARFLFTVCVQLNPAAQHLCWWIKACCHGRSLSDHHWGMSLLNALIIYFGWRNLLKGKFWFHTTRGLFSYALLIISVVMSTYVILPLYTFTADFKSKNLYLTVCRHLIQGV